MDLRRALSPILFLLVAYPAHALQPLEEFIKAGRVKAADNLEARASREVLEADTDIAWGRVLPGIAAQGSYTRNQYETVFTPQPGVTVTITPQDQWSGAIVVTVPLVNLANFWQIKASRLAREAGDRNVEATLLAVDAQVVQAYYQVVANLALVASSQRALDVANESLKLTNAQWQAGRVAELDVERARAEVERNVQQVASAQLQVTLAAQTLETLTAVKADVAQLVAVDDDLHAEPALAEFQPPVEQIPSVATAIKNRESAEVGADARRLALVPTLQGSFTESFSNNGGFSGHDSAWTAVLSLSWAFDWTFIGNIRAQDATARQSLARETRARLAAREGVVNFWNTVATNITRSRSARVQVASANHASALAFERYRVGATTQLELLQAQRDAFTAEASRVQADADLQNARIQLRIAAGKDPLAAAPPAPVPAASQQPAGKK